MTPEYYANLYRRYQTYVRQYDSAAPIQKICGGPNVDDTNWTKKVLDTCYASPNNPSAHGFMDGLSLHYYVHPGGWDKKGSATEFDEKTWYLTMEKALYIEELINMHSRIMDEFDPEKKIGLMVDEWGCWFDVEPGTNPGFLYQQSTMRDALVAAVSLNIFNRHCDRVKLACIAQMVNVLQSVVLTEGDKMILTPTYHVFHMYRHHQGAQLLDSELAGTETAGAGESSVPALQESVSMQEDGTVIVTIANMSVEKSYPVDLVFMEKKPESAEARILTNEMHAKNTFEEPDMVKEEDFDGVTLTERGASFTIPACSVVSLRLR